MPPRCPCHHILIGLQHLIHTVAHVAFLQCDCHSVSLTQNLSKHRFWPCEPHKHILNCSYCYFIGVLYLEPDFKFLEAKAVFSYFSGLSTLVTVQDTQRGIYTDWPAIEVHGAPTMVWPLGGLCSWSEVWLFHWLFLSLWEHNSYHGLSLLMFWWGISHRSSQFIISKTCQDRCYFAYFTGKLVNDGVGIKTRVFLVPKSISFSS